MKRVYTTSSDVIHLFAQRRQDGARCANVFFDNRDKIYSYGYHYLLGEFIDKNNLKIENLSTKNNHGEEEERHKIKNGEMLEYGNIEDTTLYKKIYVFNFNLNDNKNFPIKLYIYSEEDVVDRFGL